MATKHDSVCRQQREFACDVAAHVKPNPALISREVVGLALKYRLSTSIGLSGLATCLVFAFFPDLVCVPSPDSLLSNSTGVIDVCLNAESYWALALTLVALLLMANNQPADLVMLGFTVLLSVSDVISDEEAWQGFSEPSVLAIGVLFVVARALEETRAVELLIMPLLGAPTTHFSAILRLCLPVGFFSAFMNNTPIVAMLLSVVETWAAQQGLSAKVLLMPLSFASMLGGMTTLIGTSTNLVLNANINSDPDAPLEPFGMFSMTLVALPAVLVGFLYLALVAPLLLSPARGLVTAAKGEGERSARANEGAPLPSCTYCYSIEAIVGCGCGLIGKPPAQLGKLVGSHLCDARLVLRGCSVIDVARAGLDASKDEPLELKEDDRMLVRCLPDAVPLLRAVPGLRLRPEAATEALGTAANARCLVEAVVASSSPLDGMSLRQAFATPVLGQTAVWGVRQRPTGGGTPRTPVSDQDQVWENVASEVPAMADVVTSGPLTEEGSASATAVDPTSTSRDPLPEAPSAPRLQGESPYNSPYLPPASTPSPHLGPLPRALLKADSAKRTDGLPPLPEPLPSAVLRDRRSGTAATALEVEVVAEGAGERSVSTRMGWSVVAPNAHWSLVGEVFAEGPPGRVPAGQLSPTWERCDNELRSPSRSRANAPSWTGWCIGHHDVRLHAGDILLLEAPISWVQTHRTTHFWLLLGVVAKSERGAVYGARYGSAKPCDVCSRRKGRFHLAASIVCLLVLLTLSATGVVGLLNLSLMLAFVLIGVVKCISLDQAWRAISFRLLLTIAASFGPGAALTNTNVADVLGYLLSRLAVAGPWFFLFAIYIVTAALSSIISNSATVVAMYQVLKNIRVDGLSIEQILVVMMLGASSAYATPIGYQTNLMVLARGPYVFGDFVRVGGGLVVVVALCVASVALIAPIGS